MGRVSELVTGLARRLEAAGYTERAEGRIGEVEFEAVLATPPGRKPRRACAVVRAAADVDGLLAAEALLRRVRRSLRQAYVGRLPWPKRLGTFTVLLGGRDLCERLHDREGRLIDTGGWHVNVLLGAVIVDLETLRTRSDNTWGLLDTGDDLRCIQDAVTSWCRSRRRVRANPALHVA
jgi:hypothetical protein